MLCWTRSNLFAMQFWNANLKHTLSKLCTIFQDFWGRGNLYLKCNFEMQFKRALQNFQDFWNANLKCNLSELCTFFRICLKCKFETQFKRALHIFSGFWGWGKIFYTSENCLPGASNFWSRRMKGPSLPVYGQIFYTSANCLPGASNFWSTANEGPFIRGLRQSRLRESPRAHDKNQFLWVSKDPLSRAYWGKRLPLNKTGLQFIKHASLL